MPKAKGNEPCACHSGLKYKRCCRPFHRGRAPQSPALLMQSRYSAYALGLAEYILMTTDPSGPHWQNQRDNWLIEIRLFTASTSFIGLDVQSEDIQDDRGWVRFDALLRKNGRDEKMSEVSLFRHVDGRWLYHSGTQPSST